MGPEGRMVHLPEARGPRGARARWHKGCALTAALAWQNAAINYHILNTVLIAHRIAWVLY